MVISSAFSPQARTGASPDTSTLSTATPLEASSPSNASLPSALSCSPSACPSCPPSACRTPRGGKAAVDGTVRVRVAARVRPLLQSETVGPNKGKDCIEASSQALSIGKNCFVFDHVFSSSASQEDVFGECVEPLVEATLEGINGTLLAYGQTGSGKTYTMGTSGSTQEPQGALPRAMKAIFARAQERDAEGVSATTFRVSYVEIFTDASKGNTEEIRDLLHMGHGPGFAVIKPDVDGQVKLEGLMEHEVWSAHEALTLLNYGSTRRATCSTRMNESSSRSHALFALEVLQRRIVGGVPSTLTAKFQFADLAGSEKVKMSGVEGEQLSQAININHGLFVLGRVITALTEGHQHVPFRESKLTRILQNSLGGNSRTCMIACVSPSDANIADSISTLTYAAKAKEITNKPVVNRGSSCANCAQLRARLEALAAGQAGQVDQSPTALVAGGLQFRKECLHDALLELEHESSRLRGENQRLQHALETQTGESCQRTGGGTGGLDVEQTGLDGLQTTQAMQKAAKFEALFVQCSERLAALQEGSVEEPTAEDSLFYCPTDLPNDTDTLAEVSSDILSCADLPEMESQDIAWLEQEAGRKHRLLLQVEGNHQAMAALQVQSEERIRQQEAQRDILERELSRLRCELEEARSREEQFSQLQEFYDRKLAALEERNLDLERERVEARRLRAIQKKQETRLKVLQDSIRQVKTERDTLKVQLAGEVKRRKEEDKRGKERVRELEKEKSRSPCPRARYPPSGASPPGPRPQPQPGGCWERLLGSFAERTARERSLAKEERKLQDLKASLIALTARRERLVAEASLVPSQDQGADELEAGALANELASLETEAAGLRVAKEYQQEQVWMLQQELQSCPGLGQDLGDAASSLVQRMSQDELAAGAVWLCGEARRLHEALEVAREAKESREAQVSACREAAAQAQQRAAQRERAHDLLQCDYESRVAGLLHCFQADAGRGADSASLKAALGEDATALLARRVAELEEQLGRERSAAKEKGQQRLEKDMELITSFRDKDSECRLLQQQLGEANAKAERAVARGAQREAQLMDRLDRAEKEVAKRQAEVDQPTGTAQPTRQTTCTEMSWGLEVLEDFWRTTGLTANKEELLASLRADVETLCKQRLQDHMEWKRELEERISSMRQLLRKLGEALGEQPELPPEDANLLQTARSLEVSVENLSSIKESRTSELQYLLSSIRALQLQLGSEEGKDNESPPTSADGPRALWLETLQEVRQRYTDLERLERERHAVVTGHATHLEGLWEEIGLQIPEDLEEEERELLQEPLPISKAFVQYLEDRQQRLVAVQRELEQQREGWQERLQSWQHLLRPFALALPETPAALPLLHAVKGFQVVVGETERLAGDFLQQEIEALRNFYKSSLLHSVIELCNALERSGTAAAGLQALANRWEVLNGMRSEHRRIVELIASRENVEAELRQFDAEASDPARFRKRGYSGVQENKRRVDYQRHLRMLDSSLVTSTAEWSAREGMPFCVDGQEYRGAELLPTDHTHMYAWTNKQLAQKQAGTPAVHPASPGRQATGSQGMLRRTSDPGRRPSTSKRSVTGLNATLPARRSACEVPCARQSSLQQLTRQDGRMRA